MRNSRPAWWLLFAMLPLGAALLIAADRASTSAGWRVSAECTASLLVIGAIALWVHANRSALAVADNTLDGGERLHSPAEYSPAPSSRDRLEFSGIDPRQHSPTRARRAEQKNAECLVK